MSSLKTGDKAGSPTSRKWRGLQHVGHSSTAEFFDYDRDGRTDLFVTEQVRASIAWGMEEPGGGGMSDMLHDPPFP